MKFRFPKLHGFFIWIALLTATFLFLTIFAFLRDGPRVGFIIFFSFVPAACFVAYIGILNWMDIVIDDSGISRELLGSVRQQIAWNDVGLIKVFKVPAGRGKNSVRGLNVIPKAYSKGKLFLWSRIVFDERMDKSASFFVELNKYIDKHRIMVDYKDGCPNINNRSCSEKGVAD